MAITFSRNKEVPHSQEGLKPLKDTGTWQACKISSNIQCPDEREDLVKCYVVFRLIT